MIGWRREYGVRWIGDHRMMLAAPAVQLLGTIKSVYALCRIWVPNNFDSSRSLDGYRLSDPLIEERCRNIALQLHRTAI